MTNLQTILVGKAARYTAPATWRLWFRGLFKSVLHNATGAVVAGAGTNGLEGLAPETLANIGMNWNQLVAVFFSSLFLSTLSYVHKSTAPGGTQPPFQS